MLIEFDGLSISSEQDFHKRIASAFSVAQYYGNNLNALGFAQYGRRASC
ncbi:barstar family protein [Pseudomonas moraviensis]|nr:barstar family protein [Pseudomonas moraviensis]